LQIIGTLYAELDEIEARIAEKKGASFPNDENVQRKAAEAREQADESAYTTESIKESKLHQKFRPSDSLKKLYRELARLLHPDLVLDEKKKAKRHELMATANQAYQDGNEQLLAKMLAEQESSPEAIEGESIGAELIRVIRRIAQIEGRLHEIEKKIVVLEESDPFRLRSRVDEGNAEGREILVEMADQIKKDIADARSLLATLP
jgi:hypothetical protein